MALAPPRFVVGTPGYWDPENYLPQLKIQSLAGPMVYFRLRGAQRILAGAVRMAYRRENGKKWIVHVKPRREGSSSFFTGVGYQHASSRVGCNVAILANRRETAQILSNIAIRFHKYAPDALRPRRTMGLKRTLEFPDLDSRLSVNSVRDEEPLRGDAVHVLIATEISSWLPSTVSDAWVAARSAVPDEGGLIISESTPKFLDDPHHLTWQEADFPDSPWLKVFTPWTILDEYAIQPPAGWSPPKVVLDYIDRTHISTQQAYWMHTVGLPRCNNEMSRFMAEYPIDETECWIQAGDHVFSPERLRERLREIVGDTPTIGGEGTSEWTSFVTETEWKDRQAYYPEKVIIAVDPAGSWSERDYFGIEVLSITKCEQLCEGLLHTDAFRLAKKLIELSKFYNDAYIYIEANGVGDSVLSHLLALGFTRIYCRPTGDGKRSRSRIPGWWSNAKTKAEAIGFLQQLIEDGSIILHSPRLIRQLLSYRGAWDRLDRDAGGGHHDLVAAIAIAAWAWFREAGASWKPRVQTQAEKDAEAWARAMALIQRMELSAGVGCETTPWGAHR